MKSIIFAALVVVASSAHALSITAIQARDHVGETATVCGQVASATFAVKVRGQPTFLNLDRPYPQHVFTAVIWGTERAKFGQPESSYQGKSICVTGPIQDYKGIPEIIVKNPGQITVR